MIIDDLLLKINEEMFQNLDYDMILNLRDENSFDAEWMKIYNAVEKKKLQGYSNEEKQRFTKYRELAFKKVYKLSENSELASYISDDFGLIYDSEVLGYSNDWLDKLINNYANSKIPCGEI